MRATRCLVVGGDGLIGAALRWNLESLGIYCLHTSRRRGTSRDQCVLPFDVALDDPADILGDFDVAFLCAAVPGFSACANDPESSRNINVDRHAAIAAALARNGTFIVLPSSNAVFSQSAVHTDEECAPEPDTEYGRQKYDAEQAVSAATGTAGCAIVRLTKVIGPKSRLHELLAVLRRKHSVQAFSDVQLSPVTLQHVVQALIWVGRQRCSGLLHVSGLGSHSYASIVEDLAAEAMSAVAGDVPAVEAISAPKSLVQNLYRPKRADLEMHTTVRRTPLRPQELSDVIHYVSETSVPETPTSLAEGRP